MSARPLVLAIALALGACGTVGGAPFVRAMSAGDKAYTHGRYREAAELYEQAAATAERPKDRDEALYTAARCWERIGEDKKALAHYQKLTEETPPGERSFRAAYRAANLLTSQGKEKEAQALLRKILEKAPDQAIARRALRLVVEQIEATEGKAAAEAFERKLYPSVEKSGLGEAICNDLARRKGDAGDHATAAKEYGACADKYPYPFGALWDDALFHASIEHEAAGDPKAAVADLEKMLAVHEASYGNGSYDRPRMPAAALRVGELQRDKLGDKEAARKAFGRVFAEFPASVQCARAIFFAAQLDKEASRTGDACSLGKRLLEKYPHTKWARRADEVCPALAPDVEKLRAEREKRRKKGLPDPAPATED
ncbi:MAG: tetratricopeptide repeat protein [Myxococcales bacterium]|nr:tetratricopeptide repeat protein [Myxococcales bacterium]